MSHRLNYGAHSPHQTSALFKLTETLKSDLEPTWMDLIDIRTSQLNGCTFCLDMHVKEATLHGERALRLHHIAAWRESPLFTARERAVLEWTEAVTKLTPEGISDELYKRTLEQLNEKELSMVTFAVASINAWNRLSISFRPEPGSFDKRYGLDKAGLQ